MKHSITVLLIQALQGSEKAYRKLGLLWVKGSSKERILAKLCLEKSVELGDEYSFYIYHKYYSKGCQVIDDRSYWAMYHEYLQTIHMREKRKLRQHLDLGTKRQKAMILMDYKMRIVNHRHDVKRAAVHRTSGQYGIYNRLLSVRKQRLK